MVMKKNSQGSDDGTVVTYPKIAWNSNGRRLSFTKTIFNGVSLFFPASIKTKSGIT